MTWNSFEQKVLEAFRYLIDDYGYQRQSTSIHAPECWTTFRSVTTAVTVHYEIGSTPWVELAELVRDGDRAVERRRTSLELLLRERAPDEQTFTAASDDDIPRALREKARQLRTYGDDILRGDFSVFPRQREVAEENLNTRNATESWRTLRMIVVRRAATAPYLPSNHPSNSAIVVSWWIRYRGSASGFDVRPAAPREVVTAAA